MPGSTPNLNTILAPSSTPAQFAALFPAANYAVKLDENSDFYAYYKKEATQYSLLGIKSADVEQVFPNPDIQLKNLSFNGSFQDDFTNYTDSGTGTIFYAKGSRTSTYDAYGALTIPSGTYQNAMRVKYVSTQIDSADLGGATLLLQTDLIGYNWFVANQPGAYATVYYSHSLSIYIIPGFPPLVTDGGTVKSVSFRSNGMVGAFEQSRVLAGVTLHFAGSNPAMDELALNITTEKDSRDLQLVLTNIEGKVLEVQSLSLTAGENLISIPVGHLPAGAYFATLRDGQAVQTLNWQKL